MKEAFKVGIQSARCLKPGIAKGWESGLYGNRGLIQLDVKKVNLSVAGAVRPVSGAVVKYPL